MKKLLVVSRATDAVPVAVAPDLKSRLTDTDDVKSKVPKDTKDEWPKFAASLAQVAGVMKSMKPHNAVDVAIDGWYGDYLKGAYANYVSRLDDLKSLVGFASGFLQLVLVFVWSGFVNVGHDFSYLFLPLCAQSSTGHNDLQVKFVVGFHTSFS